MSEPGQPVTADAETLAVLVRDFETGASGKVIEELARELGVSAPDGRDGWELVYRYGPDGDDLGLYWVHPDDEPLRDMD